MKSLNQSLLILTLSAGMLSINAQETPEVVTDDANPVTVESAETVNINVSTEPGIWEKSRNWVRESASSLRGSCGSATETIKNKTAGAATTTLRKINDHCTITHPLIVGAVAGLFAGITTKVVYKLNRNNPDFTLEERRRRENIRALQVGLLTGTSAAAAFALLRALDRKLA